MIGEEANINLDNLGDTPSRQRYDAVIIGSGPNGLAAAVTLAQAGLAVLVVEACDTIGGGTRSKELTLPGFVHDVCSAVHPMAVASPFFRQLPLDRFGLEFIHPPAPLAHPLDGGRAALLEHGIDATVAGLGGEGEAWRDLFAPIVEAADGLLHEMLAPPMHLPSRPFRLARFGLLAVRSARGLADKYFTTDEARALWAGVAAHAILPLEQRGTAAIGLALTMAAHAFGWPVARGGSGSIASALGRYLLSLGGEIVVNRPIAATTDLPAARAYLFDLTPRQILAIAGDRLPVRYRKSLSRYRYGAGAYKIDWALSQPIPWSNLACLRAATVHVGGTLEEIAAAERAAWTPTPPPQPFVLVAQQSLFDPSRAPAGMQAAWAYAHVPHGSEVNMTDPIEAQIERFAPGFRDVILARHVMPPRQMQAYNANYIGGDITGGVNSLWQMVARPALRLDPYSTPTPDIFICSASTPPGGGVHGMCGYLAAQSALRRRFR